jgi:hypothetical protein
MSKIAVLLTPLVIVLVGSLPVAPAQAQAARTFVSGAGNDGNSCASITAPCRHFTAAYAATAAGGEIDVLDPANYGGLTIGHALSIEGQGWAFVSAVSGAAAITVNAGSGDKVNIRGVVLDGGGLANTYGIRFNAGGSLNIQDCVIRNFGVYGIDFTPSASSLLSVSSTLVSDNVDAAIAVIATGSGTVIGVIDHAEMSNSSGGLLFATSSGPTINLTVSDSMISGSSGGDSIDALSGGGPVNIMVRNSIMANNADGAGLFAEGSGDQIWVTRSTITGNLIGWEVGTGGTVSSFGDNNFVGNTNAGTAPPPLGYK